MGSLRFRRTIKLAPGVRVNVNKRSVGISAGARGARVSVNSDGRSTRSVGVPGSGLYYRSQTGPRRSSGRSSPLGAATSRGAASPSRPLRRVVVWLFVLIGVLLAFNGHAGAAGGVLAVGFFVWLFLRVFGGVLGLGVLAFFRHRQASPASAGAARAKAAAPGKADDYELAEANVPTDWRETNAWRAWEAPRNFVAGESHYIAALTKLAGKPRPHGYLLPVEVSFDREPDNPYDGNAWKALVDGEHVGYVARHIAMQLAPVLDPLHVRSFSVCGVIRGGSLEAPNLGVHVWPERRPSPGPALQQVDDALGVPWPPDIDEGADAPAVEQFNVYLGRARDTIENGGPDRQAFESLRAAADIAVANDDADQREAAAAVAQQLIRYAEGTQTLSRATRLKKRLEPKAPSSKQAGAATEARLARLKDLHDRGVISAEEYEAQRASMIKRL